MSAASTSSVFLSFEGRIGLWSGSTPPASYSDFLNFERIEIAAPEQEAVKLISRMTSSYGAALDSQAIATDAVAQVAITSSTFTAGLLGIITGGAVTTGSQAATAVNDEPITTVLDVWVPLATRRPITASTVVLTKSASTVDAAKYEVDAVLGMIKAIHADAVGSCTIDYTPAAATYDVITGGLAQSAYVHITGQALDKRWGYMGTLDIWRAQLAPSGAFVVVSDSPQYLKGELSGDMIIPSTAIRGAIPSAPWEWQRRTA